MKIAIVVSSVGYHWEEVFDVYREIQEAGGTVEFFSEHGAPAKPDPRSVEHKPFLSKLGLGVDEDFGPESPLGKQLSVRLESDLKPFSDLDAKSFDGIYLPGGHGALYDVCPSPRLHEAILEFYRAGKPIAALCHATSALAFVKDRGRPIIAGKKVTGFPQAMDDVLIKAGWVHEKFLPLPFSNEQKIREAGAVMNTALSFLNPGYHVEDTPFITGVGPKSARAVARKLIAAASLAMAH